MGKQNDDELILKEFKRTLIERPISRDEAILILQAIDMKMSVKINDIIIQDGEVNRCHWKCSARGHAPLPIVKSAKDIIKQIADPVTNPGRDF